MEGSSNDSFASFGILDFYTPTGITFNPGDVLLLTLTQDDAAFTADGALAFYLTTDTATNIDPGASPLRFDSSTAALRNGIGSQLGTKYLLGTGIFTEVANGHQDIFSFSPAGAALTYLNAQTAGAGDVRLIIAPGDPAVAATYAGFSNNQFAAPTLTLASPSVPEPSMVMPLGALLLISCSRRRGKDNP